MSTSKFMIYPHHSEIALSESPPTEIGLKTPIAKNNNVDTTEDTTMDELAKMMGKNTDTNFNSKYSGKNFYHQLNSGIQYYDSNNVIKDEEEGLGDRETVEAREDGLEGVIELDGFIGHDSKLLCSSVKLLWRETHPALSGW